MRVEFMDGKRRNEPVSMEAEIVPAQPGWHVVDAIFSSDGTEILELLFMPVVAWIIEGGSGMYFPFAVTPYQDSDSQRSQAMRDPEGNFFACEDFGPTRDETHVKEWLLRRQRRRAAGHD